MKQMQTLMDDPDSTLEPQTSSFDITRANALVAPCPKCGEPYAINALALSEFNERTGAIHTMAEFARHILDTDAVLCELDRALRDRINGLPYLCERCFDDQRDTQAAHIREARLRKLRQNCYGGGLMPRDAESWTFSSNDANLERANDETWLRARALAPIKKNLWIDGDPDVGKTRLSRCLLNATIEHGVSAGEMSAISLNVTAARFEWDRELQKFATVNTLAIDDLDKPAWTPKGLDALWWLIDRRCNSNRPTIITANTGMQAVRDMIGERAGNPTMANSIIRRLLPIERIQLTGPTMTSLRKETS